MGKHENSSDDMGSVLVAVSEPSEASVPKHAIESRLARLATTGAEAVPEDDTVYAVGQSGGMYPIKTTPIPGTNLRWAHIDK